MVDIYNRYFSATLSTEDVTDYYLEKFYGPEAKNVFLTYEKTIYHSTEPILGAAEIIDKIINSGVNVSFITARPASFNDVTINWFIKHGFPTTVDIHYGVRNKGLECARKKIDLFIEDAPSNIINLSDYLPVLIYDAPYNRTVNLHNTRRVNNWSDIDRLLFEERLY